MVARAPVTQNETGAGVGARAVFLVDADGEFLGGASGSGATVEGTLSATGDTSATPFTAVPGRAINLQFSGTWGGTVVLKRKLPGQASYSAITLGASAYGSYTTNINEPVWEEPEAGTLFILDFTRTSGTLGYRISQ